MPTFLNRVTSKSTLSREYKCTVQLLDDTQTLAVDFKKHDIGQVLLDYICEMLNIVEKDYFGLRYVDPNRHRYWLDPSKPILRQVKSSSIVFAFRVKFYPSDPTIVKEELTRYMMALQIKRDLLHGRLYCPQSDAAILGSYIVQADIGDYDPKEHIGNYVSQYKLFLNQTSKMEERIALEHQKLAGKGLTPAEADSHFLKKACMLDTYGYYPYTIKDPKNGQVYMGATPRGVLVYQTHRKLHHIKWDDIKDFDYVGKEFHMYTKPEYFVENNLEASSGDDHHVHIGHTNNINGSALIKENSVADHAPAAIHSKNGKRKSALRFICPSSTFCKQLWKYMLAQQAFFTKHRSNEVKPISIRRGLLFRRATFRYNGRVLDEIKDAPSPRRAEPSFERIHLQRQAPRNDNAPWVSKFHTLPRATKPEPNESKSSILISKEAPDNVIQDGLLLDTTIQATTPTVTPISGLSPGPSALETSITTGSMEDSSTVASTSQTITTVSPTSGGSVYKQDVITVSLKHVAPAEPDEVGSGNSKMLNSQSDKATTNGSGYTKERHRNGRTPVTPPSTPIYAMETSTMEKTSSPNTVRQKRGGVGALVKTLLTGLMFTILLIGTIIVVMEIQQPEFREYLRHIPGEDTFRHEYYEPIRQQALEWYQDGAEDCAE